MKPLKSYYQLAPVFLRLVIGIGFTLHGWAKLKRGTDGLVKLLTILDIPFPQLNAMLLPYLEFFGGLALIVGIKTRWISIPHILTMVIAMFTIHLPYGFSAVNTIGLTATGPKLAPPGYEINLLYIAGLASLMLTGAGSYSLDHLLSKRK